MTNYVVGFLFSRENNIVLMMKNKPEWQAGLLNGVGGKIEGKETPAAAMVREFEEEAGAVTSESDWTNFCDLKGDGFYVHCMKAVNDAAFWAASTTEAEEVIKLSPSELSRYECVSNLKWLIEMALDDNYGKPFFAEVQYFR